MPSMAPPCAPVVGSNMSAPCSQVSLAGGSAQTGLPSPNDNETATANATNAFIVVTSMIEPARRTHVGVRTIGIASRHARLWFRGIALPAAGLTCSVQRKVVQDV